MVPPPEWSINAMPAPFLSGYKEMIYLESGLFSSMNVPEVMSRTTSLFTIPFAFAGSSTYSHTATLHPAFMSLAI